MKGWKDWIIYRSDFPKKRKKNDGERRPERKRKTYIQCSVEGKGKSISKCSEFYGKVLNAMVTLTFTTAYRKANPFNLSDWGPRALSCTPRPPDIEKSLCAFNYRLERRRKVKSEACNFRYGLHCEKAKKAINSSHLITIIHCQCGAKCVTVFGFVTF